MKGWVIPPKGSGEFVACMERVLDVYKRPYDAKKTVVCMDESPKQLIGLTRKPLPMSAGGEQKCDYEFGSSQPKMPESNSKDFIRHMRVDTTLANA